MVYREACRFLGTEPAWNHEPLMPAPVLPELSVDVAGREDEAVLHEIVQKAYPIDADDAAMREMLRQPDSMRATHFDYLRKNYPVRREFRFTRVLLRGATPGLIRKVTGLGFGT
jgi:hypothetical protein